MVNAGKADEWVSRETGKYKRVVAMMPSIRPNVKLYLCAKSTRQEECKTGEDGEVAIAPHV
jgi:hypothetical protein